MTIPPRPLAIVCGLHRSGTTFVGEILRQAGAFVIQEPLNQHFGVADVPVAYPFIDQSGGKYAPLIDDIVSYRRKWNKNPDCLLTTGLRRKMYAYTGGRSGIRWYSLRLRSRLGRLPHQVCWKDPFATLATPYLRSHVGARIVCVVRHPAGIHHSTEKRGWGFDVENLLGQTELIARHCRDIPDKHWRLAKDNHAASIGLLWKTMMRVNEYGDDNKEGLLVIKHEDLCLSAVDTARAICNYFDLPFTRLLCRFVEDHSEGDITEPDIGDTRKFRRDAKQLPDIWRGQISAHDEELIQETTEDIVRHFYGKW